MVNRVDSDQIEEIVGHARHRRAHYGRAVSSEQQFYILHSSLCKEATNDRLDCEFSEALEDGIDMEVWGRLQDRPVLLAVYEGRLEPARIG
jgi:hypothetical protein